MLFKNSIKAMEAVRLKAECMRLLIIKEKNVKYTIC